MATRMLQRRGTAEQWTAANPVLGAGEIGFETDTGKLKVGDNVNTWLDLAYFVNAEDLSGELGDYATQEYVDTAIENVVGLAPETLDTLAELATALGDDADFSTTIFNATEVSKQEAITFAEQYTDAEITTLSDTVSGTTSNIIATADALALDVQGLSSTLDNLSGDVTEIIATADALALDVQGLSSTLVNLSGDVADVSDTVARHTTTVATHTTEIADLVTENTNQDTAIDTINTALLSKAASENPTFTGTVVLPTTTSVGDVSSAELGHLNGVTSSIQYQIDAKLDAGIAEGIYAPLNDPTFGGTVALPETTTIGDVSSDEIEHLVGVTSAIQTQIDAKAPSADPTFTGTVSGVTKTHVGLGNVDDTSDADKPVSTATQTALDDKASLAGATFTGDVTVETNMLIEGNLTISGTSTTINATDLSISDPLIYLAAEQYADDALDVGFLAATGEVGGTEESHLHSGLFRDVSDSKKWKLISNVPHPVSNVVDVTNAVKDTLVVGNIEADGVVFSDGTQTKMGVASLTEFVEKTASYTLDDLDHKDNVVEMNSSDPVTFTIPANSDFAWPIGASMDIIATGTGLVTIMGADEVTVNSTPGLKLRTQWSSATILKRGPDTWIAYGDLKA
jgi:uncharacterized protein YoxC